MGLVADGEIELRHPRGLRVADRAHRLVGGEDHGQPLRGVRRRRRGQRRGVGGGGDGEVAGAGAVPVRRADLRVGTDGEGADRDRGVGGPLAQGLRDERDRGGGEERAPAPAGELLGGAQGGVGLAGPAGHDQLAAAVRGEARGHVRERGPLVRAELLARALRERVRLAVEPAVPVDGGGLGAEEVEALHRRALVRDQGQRVGAPVRRGADDEPLAEVGVGVGEEGGDVRLADRGPGVVALDLDRREAAAAELGDEVDPDVAAPAAGPLAPEPDAGEPPAEAAVGLQHLRHERLETPPPLLRVGPALAQARVHVPERRGHPRLPPPAAAHTVAEHAPASRAADAPTLQCRRPRGAPAGARRTDAA